METSPLSRPRHANRAVAAAMALALALPGCADMGLNGTGAPLTPQQQALRQQQQNWNQTVATGAILTSALGAGLGALAGGSGNRGRGAVIGGLAGLLTGLVAGSVVANSNQRQAQSAQTAEERLASAQQAAQQLEQTANAAEQTATDNRARLAQLDRQYRAGQVTAAQYRAEAATMREDVQVMRKAVTDADKARLQMTQAVNSTPGLAAQERKLGEAQSRLSFSATELEDALQRVPAG